MDHLQIYAFESGPGIGTLRIEGAVDASNVSRVKDALDEFFRLRIFRVVLDLGKARYIASSGFSLFLAALDTAKEHGGRIVCAATPLEIREIFELLGLHAVLEFAPDENAALNELEEG